MVHWFRAVPVALVGDNAAELELNMPGELVDCVNLLSIRVDNDPEVSAESAALARLLVSCRNASYLEIAGRSMYGLAMRGPAPHLTQPIFNLRTIFISVYPSHWPAEEVASLLNRLPNLERVLALPETSRPFPEDSLITQRRFTELQLTGSYMSLLPLITSGRWTTEQLTLWFSEKAEAEPERVDWPPAASVPSIKSLSVMLPPGAPLASAARFVTCCSALRRLELNDLAGQLVAILPTVLHHCHGLRVLLLRFLASVDRTQPRIHSICSILVGSLLPALRSLFLQLRTQGQRAVFDELVPVCRARRVKLDISLSRT